jgi:hypothetical protein
LGGAFGEPCQRVAGEGVPGLVGVAGVPCRLHGGRTPPAVAAGHRRRLEAECQALLGEYDVGPVDQPVEELCRLAGQVVGWKNLLADRVATLRAEDSRRADRFGEELRAELGLLERGMDRCAKVLTDLSKLGLEERRTRIREAELDLYGQLVEAAVVDLCARHGVLVDIAAEDARAVLYARAQELEANGA